MKTRYNFLPSSPLLCDFNLKPSNIYIYIYKYSSGAEIYRIKQTQTSGVSPQHAFAMRAGRSPQQFQFTNPVPLSSSFPQRESMHHYPAGAPSLQTLQSLGIDSSSAPALEEYLGQNNRHEPFHGLSRGAGDDRLGFGGARMFKDYQSLTIDPTLDSFSAPQMRHQLSSSAASDYLTGGEEGYLDSPQSFSYPMNRHSRSYSHGSFNSSVFSSSQADSASPTDHLVFGHHPGSYSMSRQASGASFIHGGLSMLRVRSSTGDSITDSMGSVCGSAERDIDGLLNGVGGFASEGGDVSSLDKASAQIVLKRCSSVSVDDLKDSMAIKGQHNNPHASTPSSLPNPRKQRRIKEEKVDEENINIAEPEKTVKSETPKKPDNAARQTEKKSPGGGRHLPAIKPGKNPNNAPVSTAKPSYIRPPHPRVYCDKCIAHPEGFRGDHELRRHTDREHASTRKMYVIKDISKGKTLLAKCKACQSGKKYGVDYNAAAHLRRQHFKPKTRSKNKQKIPATIDQTVPEMAELRKWMEEVEVRVEAPRDGESYTKRDPKSEYGTRTHHEGDEGDETSEENEEESQQMDEREEGRGTTTYQEIGGDKMLPQQSAMEIIQSMELGLDSVGPSPQADLTWALNSYSGSVVSGATYTLSNSQMPQQLTHDFDFHVSATTGAVPLVGGAFNHQQNLGIHLPTQHAHQMLMQENLLLPPSFTQESHNAVFNYLPTTSRPTGIFDDFGGLQDLFQGDLKPY